MKTTVNNNTGTINGNHSAVLKHSWATVFPCHTNGRIAGASLPWQFHGMKDFLSVLRHDRRLLALLSSAVCAGLALGAFFYMVVITLLSRPIA
jgi:hypothetical protein